VGDLVALADAAHVGAAGLAVGYATRFLTTQNARVRADSQDEVPMEPTMYGRLTTAMTTTVSRRHGTPDGDDGDNEPVWSLELASSWARLDAACGFHALAESEPLISTALAMLPPQRPTVARAGFVARGRSNNEQIAQFLDGLPLNVPFSAFATYIFPRLQADISERVNLLRFAKLAPTVSHRTRPESRRFTSRLGHGALAFLASDPPTLSRLGELRAKFPEHYDAVSASRSVASSVYPHPAPSLVCAPPLPVLLVISRFKLCGVRSRRRVLTCRMMRGPLLLVTIWLDTA
jgi:hypothetical protein